MANVLDLNGYINEKGEVVIQNKRLLRDWANQFKGKNIKIRIQNGKKRSLPQNDYYHAVVVEEVRLGFINLGYIMNHDQTHEWLKEKFNPVMVENKQGVMIEMPGSTTDTTTVTFAEYIERIAQFAAEFLGIAIPPPTTKLEMQLH